MEILKISIENLKKTLKKILIVIKKGGVVVCPTDTVYGLIAEARNKTAVKKVFEIKKRLSKKPLPVFVRDLKMAKCLAVINKNQESILNRVWPGKVTAVLKAKSIKFPDGVLSKNKKIGLRIPCYKILNTILEKVDCPLTATSANISGKPASTKIKEILKQFENQKYQPDLVLDAGNLRVSLPSAVLDLTDFKILREGQFSKKEILKILKEFDF